MDYAGSIKSGDITQAIHFERPPNFTSFTVQYSLKGSAWATFTAPVVTEQAFTSDLSIYKLVLNQHTTAASAANERLSLRISASGMATVYLWCEIETKDLTHVLGLPVGVGGTAPASPIGYA